MKPAHWARMRRKASKFHTSLWGIRQKATPQWWWQCQGNSLWCPSTYPFGKRTWRPWKDQEVRLIRRGRQHCQGQAGCGRRAKRCPKWRKAHQCHKDQFQSSCYRPALIDSVPSKLSDLNCNLRLLTEISMAQKVRWKQSTEPKFSAEHQTMFSRHQSTSKTPGRLASHEQC